MCGFSKGYEYKKMETSFEEYVNSIFTELKLEADEAKRRMGFHLTVSHPLIQEGVLETWLNRDC